jgi:serine/threonine protein kinase
LRDSACPWHTRALLCFLQPTKPAAACAQSENILVALDGHLKLADFASAKQLLGRVGALPPPRAELSMAGAPHSVAPEVIRALPACEDADWWSLGVLAAEVLSGRNPFEPDDGSVHTLLHNILVVPFTPPAHPHIGAAETAFLSALLTREPDERLASRVSGGHAAVFAHPWFAGLTAYTLLTKQAPAPWLPHHDGPAPAAPPPPSAELIAMAALHATGTPPPPPGASGTSAVEWSDAGFAAAFGGQPALVDIVGTDDI